MAGPPLVPAPLPASAAGVEPGPATLPAQSAAPAKVSLVEEISSLLRERIYDRRYPAGAALRQEQLSAELGISRTPVREALRVLEQEGLVRVEPGQGARVVMGDRDSLLAAYELRAVVDGLAARLAALRGPADARHLERSIATQRAALDPWQPLRYTEANVEFHEHVLMLSGNEYVLAQRPVLRMTAQVFAPVELLERERAVRAVAEHTAIAEAIAGGDPDAAEQLARAHIRTTIDDLTG
ncbi:FCD domain-containing protein [Nakamurella sp. YIM 132087]|uniref:FCD domain-containing protein n=1 Tax=Nakamurella alba TaxID=2665158 RepID=A0A7K1FKN1_9ACTN|nr:GntR family transcriptional regulator [Nakamurella alba]MTD14707.1 FCD domain-containing protein [Nakamurella alba]